MFLPFLLLYTLLSTINEQNRYYLIYFWCDLRGFSAKKKKNLAAGGQIRPDSCFLKGKKDKKPLVLGCKYFIFPTSVSAHVLDDPGQNELIFTLY